MDIPYEDLAPLFEAYGAACFQAQHLEHGLLLLLKILQRPALGKKPTLGKLIKHAKDLKLFTSEDSRSLRSALELRNNLVHGYWHQDKVLNMRDAHTRSSIKRELEAYQADLRVASALIDGVIDSLLIHWGESLVGFGDAAIKDWQTDIAYAEKLLENL
mgnify:CR=1 FL=1